MNGVWGASAPQFLLGFLEVSARADIETTIAGAHKGKVLRRPPV